MARIKQFANDMGMSYNQAKNLVNKGRKLKDGGTSVLESMMNKVKPIKAEKGLSYNEMFPPITQDEFDELNPKSNIDKLNELSDKKKKQRKKNRKAKVPDRVKGIKDKGDVPPKKIKAKLGTSVNTKKGSDFGMLSVKASIDKNPNPTKADRIAGATMKEKPVTASKGRYQSKTVQFRGCGSQVKGKKFKGIF